MSFRARFLAYVFRHRPPRGFRVQKFATLVKFLALMPPATRTSRATGAHRPNSEERGELRRAQILDAAYKVFSSKGYRDTTIADVAAELGMGHGTFYRYFTNKYDIFQQVLKTALVRVSQAIASEDPKAANTLDEYRAQVERIGGAMLALLDRDPAIPRLLFYEAMGVSPELDDRIQQGWEFAGKVTEAYLVNGKRKGFLRADLDTHVTALAINALIFEGGRRVLRSKDREVAKKRWLQGLVALIFQGVSA
jgi:AcrR family transcriptional regulator